MTSQLAFSEMISHAARIHRAGAEDSLLKADQTVDKLEHRAWRVRSLNGSVEHRFVRIGQDLVVVLSEVSKHVYIDTRAGDHGQDLSCRRLDSNQAAHLVVHEHLTVVLELSIDGGCDIVSWHCFLVHLSILISGFDLVA